MNTVGNRHVSKNIRILLVNNALGAEFHLFKQLNSIYVNDIPKYLSAGGHFGHQSPTLVRHYAEDLGYEYLSASNKEEFEQVYSRFVTPELTGKPMIFEVFTRVEDENEALKLMWNLEIDTSLKGNMKRVAKGLLGESGINTIKSILKK